MGKIMRQGRLVGEGAMHSLEETEPLVRWHPEQTAALPQSNLLCGFDHPPPDPTKVFLGPSHGGGVPARTDVSGRRRPVLPRFCEAEVHKSFVFGRTQGERRHFLAASPFAPCRLGLRVRFIR